MDQYLYLVLALVITVILGILTLLKWKNAATTPETATLQPRQRDQRTGGNEAPRNRALAARNARARMRVAQAQRLHTSDSEEEEEEEQTDRIVLPEGKIGKKKLAKLQMKAEKKAMREADERDREEKKKREEENAEKRRQLEREMEEEEARQEEEEQRKRKEQERKEQEEYEMLKVQFEIQEEGCDEQVDSEKAGNRVEQFLNYIKENKVVVLQDLAAEFDLKMQTVIDRITTFQKDGTLTGVIDDRGKFIYITLQELESVAQFIRNRGRVSISDIAEASNSLINLDSHVQAEA